MRTLELKDICGYLPYGLKYQWTNMKSVRLISMTDEVDYSSQHSLSTAWEWMVHRQARPILRPMSDLTKEITHKGEKFVPFEKFIQLNTTYETCYEYKTNSCGDVCIRVMGQSVGSFSLAFMVDHNGILVIKSSYITSDGYRRTQHSYGEPYKSREFLEYMDSLFIDYRGLISAGLAIDVNTLPENPYEK